MSGEVSEAWVSRAGPHGTRRNPKFPLIAEVVFQGQDTSVRDDSHDFPQGFKNQGIDDPSKITKAYLVQGQFITASEHSWHWGIVRRYSCDVGMALMA